MLKNLLNEEVLSLSNLEAISGGRKDIVIEDNVIMIIIEDQIMM